MEEALFLIIASCIVARGFALARSSRMAEGLVSTIAAAVYFTCLWVPARLQEAGLIASKIQQAGLMSTPHGDEISSLSVRWSVELLIVAIAEILAVGAVARKVRSAHLQPQLASAAAEKMALTLIVVGAIATIVFPAAAIERRAEGGQGVAVMLRSFFVVGLALLAFHNFFRRNMYRVLALAGIGFLVASHVRSPLLVVLFGYGAGLMARGQLRLGVIARLTCIGVVLAIFAAGMSNVRGAILRRAPLNAEALVAQTIRSPYKSVYEAGVDTLDGYRLSRLIQPNEPPRPLAFATIITNFIPRAIWPSKPTDLSVEMSAKYLRYGAGGQFLSPVGFMNIAFGSYLLAVLGLGFFAAAAAILVQNYRSSFLLAIIACVVFRFFMGGAPFDIYYGITLLIPFLTVKLLFERRLLPLKSG